MAAHAERGLGSGHRPGQEAAAQPLARTDPAGLYPAGGNRVYPRELEMALGGPRRERFKSRRVANLAIRTNGLQAGEMAQRTIASQGGKDHRVGVGLDETGKARRLFENIGRRGIEGLAVGLAG